MSKDVKDQEIDPSLDPDDDFGPFWLAGPKDDYDLKKKMLRVGCQGPIKQNLLCMQQRGKEFTLECAVSARFTAEGKERFEGLQEVTELLIKARRYLTPGNLTDDAVFYEMVA